LNGPTGEALMRVALAVAVILMAYLCPALARQSA